jgi:hypothetical protein
MKQKTLPALLSCQLWIEEIVLGLNLCPFAHKPWAQGEIELRDSEANDWMTGCQHFSDIISENIFAWNSPRPMGHKRSLILVFSQLQKSSFQEMQGLTLQMERLLNSQRITFKLIAFHPAFCLRHLTKRAAENLVNRSPYPMWHLLLWSDLEELQSSSQLVQKTNTVTLRTYQSELRSYLKVLTN